MLDTSGVAHVDRDNPWLGLTSFTEAAKDFFFGREQETDELLRLVKRSTLTVLFGQSGLGKTSLLQAGLFPALRQNEFLPIYIRLDLGPASPDFVEQVKAAIVANLSAQSIEAPPPHAADTLWEYFHRDDIDFWDARNHLITPILVFDQFEELFTLGQSDATQRQRGLDLVEALADLIENRVPHGVAHRLDEDPERARQFDFGKQQCKVLLSFREDFLAEFEGLRARIPSIMTNRKRLERMTGVQALDVVVKAGSHLVDAAIARRIIAFVANRQLADDDQLDQAVIEPSLLSVFCRELNSKRQRAGQARITEDLLSGAQDNIIIEFYDRSVADLSEAVRRFIETHLLTETGYRNSCALDDALAMPGITRAAIDILVARRLIRLEERLGTLHIELTHDLLTAVIKHRRDQRTAAEALQAAETVRRARRRRLALVGVTVAAALGIAVMSLVYQTERVMGERQLFLNSMAQFTTELSDKFRFVPGTIGVMQAVVAENDRLLIELRRGPQNLTGLAALTPRWLDQRIMPLLDDGTAMLRLQAANTILKGDIQVNTGRFTVAAATYNEALKTLLALIGSRGDDTELRREHSAVLSKLALVLNFTSQPRAGLEHAQRAADVARSMQGTGQDWEHDLVIALSGMVQAHLALGQQGAADQASRERLRIASGQVAKITSADKAEMFFWRREVGFGRAALGNAALGAFRRHPADDPAGRTARLAEARQHFEAVLASAQELIRDHQEDSSAVISARYADMVFGNFESIEAAIAAEHAGQREPGPTAIAASRRVREACRLFEGLSDSDPASVWWKFVGSQCDGFAGDADVRIHQYERARLRFDRAIKLQEAMMSTDPRFVQPLRELGRLHEKRGNAFWELAERGVRSERGGPAQNRDAALADYAKSLTSWESYRKAWSNWADASAAERSEYDQVLPRLRERLTQELPR